MRLVRAVVGAVVLLGLPLCGQQARTPVATGLVSGHVICSDTRKPARFADVALVRKQEPPPAGVPYWLGGPQTPESLMLEKTRTDIEGGFVFPDVPEGDYYVVATMGGYVLPVPLVKAANAAKPDASEVMAQFPLVHVTQTRPATAEISITRGGGISGTVRFDDGSPVVGAQVSAVPTEGRTPSMFYLGMGFSRALPQGRSWETDDAGHYRISGLAPGKYLLRMTLQLTSAERMIGNRYTMHFSRAHAAVTEMQVYAPGSFLKSEGKAVEITGDEMHADADIEVALSGLHTVRGRLQAGEDLHAPAAARLSLTNGDGLYRDSAVAADGTFHFDLVPSGSYKLEVNGAYDLRNGSSLDDNQPETGEGYLPEKLDVLVEEHDVVLDPMTLKAMQPKKPRTQGN